MGQDSSEPRLVYPVHKLSSSGKVKSEALVNVDLEDRHAWGPRSGSPTEQILPPTPAALLGLKFPTKCQSFKLFLSKMREVEPHFQPQRTNTKFILEQF